MLCGVFGIMFLKDSQSTAPKKETATSDSAPFSDRGLTLSLAAGDAKVIGIDSNEEKYLTKWKSSNEMIAAVDSGGRVDALKKGKAKITAEFSDGHKVECELTVTAALEKEPVSTFTTAITANYDILKKNLLELKKENKESDKTVKKLPYRLMVNREQNCVTAYTFDKDGKYTVPVRAMACSCGLDSATVTGAFNIYFHTRWHPLMGGVFGQYAGAISDDYLFHSVPYTDLTNDSLMVGEYNKLGECASKGCIRMAVADCKWIYKYCPIGTIVVIYDNENPGPLGKPESIKITDENCGWDPTDYDENNPYNSNTPQINGAEDVKIKTGTDFDVKSGVTATDTCGNDITGKLEITGHVDTDRAGVYKITYSVTDALHRSQKVDITVKVVAASLVAVSEKPSVASVTLDPIRASYL